MYLKKISRIKQCRILNKMPTIFINVTATNDAIEVVYIYIKVKLKNCVIYTSHYTTFSSLQILVASVAQ